MFRPSHRVLLPLGTAVTSAVKFAFDTASTQSKQGRDDITVELAPSSGSIKRQDQLGTFLREAEVRVAHLTCFRGNCDSVLSMQASLAKSSPKTSIHGTISAYRNSREDIKDALAAYKEAGITEVLLVNGAIDSQDNSDAPFTFKDGVEFVTFVKDHAPEGMTFKVPAYDSTEMDARYAYEKMKEKITLLGDACTGVILEGNHTERRDEDLRAFVVKFVEDFPGKEIKRGKYVFGSAAQMGRITDAVGVDRVPYVTEPVKSVPVESFRAAQSDFIEREVTFEYELAKETGADISSYLFVQNVETGKREVGNIEEILDFLETTDRFKEALDASFGFEN